MKKYFIIVGLILIIIGTFLKTLFFFNPLTFRQDNITYLPYYYYTKTMTYSYWDFKGNKVLNRVDNDELKLVYNELKKSKMIDKEKEVELDKNHSG